MVKVLLSGLGIVILVPIVILFGSLLLAFPLKWTWNYVIPFLFGLPKISALQAFCLAWVSGVLFKSSITTSK